MPTYPRPLPAGDHYGVVVIDATAADTWTNLTSASFRGPDGEQLPAGLVLVGYAVQNEDAAAGNYVYTARNGYTGGVGNATRTPGGSSVGVNLRGVGGSAGEPGLAYRKVSADTAGQIRAWFEEPQP